MTIVIIILLIFVIILLFINTSIKKIDAREEQLKVEELQHKNMMLQYAIQQQQDEKEKYSSKINNLIQEKEKLDTEINQKKICLVNYEKDIELDYQNKQQQMKNAASLYFDSLEKSYKTKEEEYDKKCAALVSEMADMQSQYAEIQSQLVQGAAAALREREKKEKINFYKLKLSDSDSIDIKELFELRKRFRNPSALSKLIWSEYFLKQTSELCNRVLGTNTKCGIYKITNLISNQAYIGQSVDIASRFKQHIKCGLGIDAPASNKLYKSMIEDGVWNFSFELLEECPKEKLNERESFWIDLYQTNKVGLNSTKGNG